MDGERAARDAEGNVFYVSDKMTFEEWKAEQDEPYGAGTIDMQRKMSYNRAADKAQYEKYKERLGADAPRSFAKFQDLKYPDDLTDFYRYREALVASGEIRAKGTIVAPPSGFIINDNNSHALGRLEKRSITLETAQTHIDNARFALKQQRGKVYAFYSEDGFAFVNACRRSY